MNSLILLAIMATAAPVSAPVEQPIELGFGKTAVHGTLLVPAAEGKVPVAVIIAGSGPTDRDGNSAALPGKNDSLKMLAAGLAEQGIASLRYDKRGIGASKEAGPAEADLRFDTYVEDAAAWIKRLRADERFSHVIVVGHSEGALIGTIAAHEAKADALVAIAGTGRTAGDLLRAQLAGKLPPELAKESERVLKELEAGRTVADAPPALASIYRSSVQPYMISWLRRDPAKELAKVKVPVLIVQGSADVQVTAHDAELLRRANAGAEVLLVEKMNHVLKRIDDPAKQMASYSDPSLPVMPQLVERIGAFVKRLGK
ncbi:MAG TPA: alpha/beta fold hydrolase [Thermoanaerobaculia bacterium]